MKALVTGANGFLGRHVVAALLGKGHEVRAMVRPAARLRDLAWPESVEVVRADLRVAPPGELTAAFAGVDVLIHLAAAVGGGEDAQFATTVVGTERLLDAMAGAGTRRLVLCSSFSVYDWSAVPVGGALTEDSPLLEAPVLYERDGYAIAKTWQERVTRRAADRQGWDLTVIRPGFIWGPGHGYPAGLAQKLGRFHLAIGPRARPPLTYVENCADLFAVAAADPRASGRTFNAVDGDDVRLWRHLGECLRLSGERGLRVPVPYALGLANAGLARLVSRALFGRKGRLPSILTPRKFEARFKPLRFPNDRVREALGWSPPVPFDEGLRRTFARPEAGPDADGPPRPRREPKGHARPTPEGATTP